MPHVTVPTALVWPVAAAIHPPRPHFATSREFPKVKSSTAPLSHLRDLTLGWCLSTGIVSYSQLQLWQGRNNCGIGSQRRVRVEQFNVGPAVRPL
jgi:hypothetical protein